MATALNAGEGTQEQLSETKFLRLKLLKMAEIVDATSKKIATLEIEGEEEGSPGMFSFKANLCKDLYYFPNFKIT